MGWREDLERMLDAEAPGSTIEVTQKSHIRIRVAGGGIVHCSNTPSDHRAILNVRADIRRSRRRALAVP